MSDSEKFKHFWSKVEIRSEFYCWHWIGWINRQNGYGQYHLKNAHRQAYILTFGQVAKGVVVRHKCDNRICVNPNHLIAGTGLDNCRDMWERNRSVNVPLSDEQIREIRKSTETQAAMSKRFGVVNSVISNICTGKKYKWVEPC